MKTVFFESLRYKLITKNYFYYGSCPDIHFMIKVCVRFVVETFLQNFLYLYYHKFPFFLDHKIMTKLSRKRWVFVQVGINNTSRKIHLSKVNFAKNEN